MDAATSICYVSSVYRSTVIPRTLLGGTEVSTVVFHSRLALYYYLSRMPRPALRVILLYCHSIRLPKHWGSLYRYTMAGLASGFYKVEQTFPIECPESVDYSKVREKTVLITGGEYTVIFLHLLTVLTDFIT